MLSEMLAAGANERGLKYRIAVKYVDFILFIKKSRKKRHECWPGVLVGTSSFPSLTTSSAPWPEHDGEDAAGL